MITPSLLIDADGGYTRQVTGAQSTVDIAAGDYGLTRSASPAPTAVGPNYVGQPAFAFCNTGSTNGNCFSSLGNANGANPFLFRDNQFTGDINVSWTLHNHATKYGFTYYHFDLNHFQPTSGADINTPRGGFRFQGGMTSNTTTGSTDYNALADFLLGLPNNGTGLAVAKSRPDHRSQLPALDRARPLRPGPVERHRQAHRQLRYSLRVLPRAVSR